MLVPPKVLTLLAWLSVGDVSAARAADAYTLVATIPLGQPDHWDYVVSDPASRHVYVAHGSELTVIDGVTDRLIGTVASIAGGTHGTAISHATGEGFTDDGENGRVIAFNPKTFAITKTISVAPDADAMASEPRTGRVFVVEGDPGTISVIDPGSNTVVATITAGEKVEYVAADGTGRIFAAGEEKSDLVAIDARTGTITARWPTPGCVRPHGLASDAADKRLFMGCENDVMMVLDADNGRIVASLPIGAGSDAIAFDANRRRVFSSNGKDGTVSIYQQVTPDRYELIESLHTAVSGRTMAVDAASGKLFVAAADTSPGATPGARRRVVPGTLKVLVFAPVR